MHENFVDTEAIASWSYSSQQTNFPATNIFDLQRRAKVWRTNGCWEITSSNNVIKFAEGGGTLTATIAESTYTSTTSFLAAVKAALEAAGALTYTVTHSSTTFKITIAATGTFSVDWEDPASTAADVLGFAFDDSGGATYTADLARLHTSEWIKFDLGMSSNPEAVALIGQRGGPIKISPTATVRLQGNATDVWSSPAYDEVLTYHEYAIGKFNAGGLHTEALRYWRIKIIDQQNTYGYVEISNIYLGPMLAPDRGAVQFPLKDRWEDNTVTIAAESGHIISNRRPKTKVFGVEWFGLTVADKEELDDLFESHGLHKPFFIHLDPSGAFSSESLRHLKFVRFTGEPDTTLESPGNFSAGWTVREEM